MKIKNEFGNFLAKSGAVRNRTYRPGENWDYRFR